jgi:hypothetical protein
LEYSLKKNIRIINAASPLHNFVIDSDKLDYSSVSSGDRDAIDVLEHPDGNTGNWGYLTNLPSRSREIDSGVRRANILSAIQAQDLQRPSHNIDRNVDDDDDNETLYAEDIEDDDVGFLPIA